jgi:hypothetical protein
MSNFTPGVKEDKRSPIRPLPCAFEGPVLEWCKKCGDGVNGHIRRCDLYGKCTLTTINRMIRGCDQCKDYVAARA